MSDPRGTTVQHAPPIPYIDRDRAPVIFFDQAPTAAYSNGVVAITISTDVFMTSAAGPVTTEHAIVAHLKTNVAGAKALRAMLDKALLMAEPVSGEAN